MDAEKGIVQVTIADERWYFKPTNDPVSGVPVFKAVPSSSWISSFYPKGVEFYKWLATKGWDESQAIKNAAGIRGTKIHTAIGYVLEGKEVRIDSKFTNPQNGQEEELTLEECDGILSFVRWYKETKPEILAWEYHVFNDKHNYAGTIDLLCKIRGVLYVVDFKTGQYIWPEYELQVSSYRQAVIDGFHGIESIKGATDAKMAILQVGYQKNKNQFKFTELEPKFPLFLAAQQIWADQHAGDQPSKKDYPIILSPEVKKEVPAPVPVPTPAVPPVPPKAEPTSDNPAK